jgi:Flp pilus assembly pilin Flp
MMTMLRNLWKDEEGALAVEYVLLVALLALGLGAAFIAFENSISTTYTDVAGRVAGAAADPNP